MPIDFEVPVPILGAPHIIGTNYPTTPEVMTINKDGTFTLEPFFVSNIDPGFRADFNTFNFNAQITGAANEPAGVIASGYTGTGANDSTVGNLGWVGPTLVEGNTPSTGARMSMSTGTISYYLKCTDFGLNIPAGLTIEGIEVTARISTDAATPLIQDSNVKLVKGGTISGDNKASGTWPDSGEGTINKTWGGPTDLWGLSWTPSDINASTFGAAVSISTTAESGTDFAYMYWLSITVYYSLDISVTHKWQVKPFGQAWEDIDGATGTNTWTIAGVVISDVAVLEASDFTNNDLPADIRLLITGTGDLSVSMTAGEVSAHLIGTSVTGTSTNYLFDWTESVNSLNIILTNSNDVYQKAITNPSLEPAYYGVIDPGLAGDISNLEVNMTIYAGVSSGTQSTTLKWQIRPFGESVWKDVISEVITLSSTVHNRVYHADFVPGDFTGWTSGLRVPFEVRMVYSFTGTNTIAIINNVAANNVRARGDVD